MHHTGTRQRSIRSLRGPRRKSLPKSWNREKSVTRSASIRVGLVVGPSTMPMYGVNPIYQLPAPKAHYVLSSSVIGEHTTPSSPRAGSGSWLNGAPSSTFLPIGVAKIPGYNGRTLPHAASYTCGQTRTADCINKWTKAT